MSILEIKPVRWYRTWWGLILIIVLAVIFLGMLSFGFYVYTIVKDINSGKINNNIISQITQPGPYQMENNASPSFGAANPKITIVEFSDFNCPYCQELFPIIREMSFRYKDDIKLIYRHYPLTQASSLDLALASECAHEQSLFWNLHDLFFQTENPGEKITQLASQLNLNLNQFNKCRQDKKYLNKIQLDILDANKAAIKGTPTWFINGHKVEGVIAREDFIEIIDTLLQSYNQN